MAYAPAPIRRDSVITRAAQELCRLIEAEDLRPGATLPTETRLAQMLGISRNSVREALRVLHGLGYVEKAAGRRVVVTAASQSGKGIFDEGVMLEAAPVANEVRSHLAQKCAELAAERLTLAEIATLERALATFEDAVAREDMAAAKGAHDSFYGLFLAGARNPLLIAMFNQAQVARLSNVSPEHKSFYDPATWPITARFCARCANGTSAPPRPWCAGTTRVSGRCWTSSRRVAAAAEPGRRAAHPARKADRRADFPRTQAAVIAPSPLAGEGNTGMSTISIRVRGPLRKKSF